MNALFSATHISFLTYFAGTAVSLVKLALHVYIGSTLSSLVGTPTPPPPSDGGQDAPSSPPPENGSRTLKIVVMVFSMLLAVAVGAYIWHVALKEIEEMEQSRLERRRKKRESLARQRRRLSAAGRGEGGGAHGQERSAAMALARSTSSDTVSSPDDPSRHHHLQGLHAMGGEAIVDVDLTHASTPSRFGLEPEEYYVGGARVSSDDEDDRGGDGGGEHDALFAGGRSVKSNRVGEGYYGDQFNDDEDLDEEEGDGDDDEDYDSSEDSDFLGERHGYVDDDGDATDEEERDQDLDDMERGQDDVLDLSAAFEPTYGERSHNSAADYNDDEHSDWFSQRIGDSSDRW
ncbi:hypothetical protein DFQ26_004490 [Actinomortierella ambigua]|nr:hypothetical protein DFQ26_004490 [Actinomortierella ambigua]